MFPAKSFFLKIFAAASLVLLPSFAPVTWAGVGGSISGDVKDASGAAIPGASVTATNTSTGVQQATITDDHGSYSFLSLPVGRYDIEVDARGIQALPACRRGH